MHRQPPICTHTTPHFPSTQLCRSQRRHDEQRAPYALRNRCGSIPDPVCAGRTYCWGRGEQVMNGKIMSPALLALLLAACGGGLSGTFEDEMGMSAYTFHGGGRVVQSSPLVGVEREMKYELDGDQVRVMLSGDNDATLVLMRVDDDTLSGPLGIRYRSQ